MASAARTSLLACARTDVEDLSRALKDPAWLRDRRLEAWDRWERTPMPDKTDETWRRTDITKLDLAAFEPMPDGTAELTQLPEEVRRQGVVFTDLASALREHEELLRDHLLTTVTSQDGKFAALHAAFLTGGSFLHVPAGVSVEIPLRAVTRQAAPGVVSFPHALVVAGRGSRVLLLEEAVGQERGDAPALSVAATEVVVGEGAEVQHAQVNRYGSGAIHLLNHRARVERDGRYQNLLVSLGGRITKVSIQTLLLGSGAESHGLGVVYGEGGQHFDHDTLQDHRAPHTRSSLLFKVALAGRARSVYTGLLRMRKTALSAEASQTNRNLLLSSQAKADSIPKLEIEVNEVRCSHAAACSSVDPEQVFYLESRGLPRPEAVRLIVDGFFSEVLDRFPLPELRERITPELDARVARQVA